ncbi:MAG: PDDEXK nuclease domain-containing protein [Bacteroidota bacterium]|nr:PDDEXK nuclease domain-containing protein [Bacteroidota bacterium]
MIDFYWWVGNEISEKQKNSSWGDKVIDKLAKDLRKSFPDMTGLSKTNLKYCKRFFSFYSENAISQQLVDLLKNKTISIGQQPVDQLEKVASHEKDINNTLIIKQLALQIPWSHNINIFTKSKNIEEAVFYITQTIENHWGRETLAFQIKSELYKRQGKAITNFTNTLAISQSDLAKQTIKDPYVFDFMTMTEPFVEKDIEDKLVNNVTKFLLELGKGFAFMGHQYHLVIANNDYYIDLLFYHTKLKCYVVIELKNTKFIPEYAGKMNFYLSAVDKLVKDETDNPTIGIILCRDKNNIEAEFALNNINSPMGISEMQFTEVLPEELISSLPTIEELEKELK